MASSSVPENISEEYYQINQAILASFPKYRPPLDFFVFKEDIAQLVNFSRKGDRLSNEQVEEAHRLCAEGDLFVSRADHPIYSEHIVKQLDLVLMDQHLKEAEVADICVKAMEAQLAVLFEQPVQAIFDEFFSDLMVVTEYLWADIHRTRLLMRRLHKGTFSLPHQSVNTFCVGMWLYVNTPTEEMRRQDFNMAALALLVHDVGMAKVPAFITGKTTPLKTDEREKIPPHTINGYKILEKLGQTADFVRQGALEHHERLDGSGYPRKAKEISRFGRLTAVADAFSAMLQTRPYSPSKSPLEAAKELSADKNRFDINYAGKLLGALLSDGFGKAK